MKRFERLSLSLSLSLSLPLFPFSQNNRLFHLATASKRSRDSRSSPNNQRDREPSDSPISSAVPSCASARFYLSLSRSFALHAILFLRFSLSGENGAEGVGFRPFSSRARKARATNITAQSAVKLGIDFAYTVPRVICVRRAPSSTPSAFSFPLSLPLERTQISFEIYTGQYLS